MTKINKVAVIGTGVIGAGWIISCLAHNKIVHAYYKDIKLKKSFFTDGQVLLISLIKLLFNLISLS